MGKRITSTARMALLILFCILVSPRVGLTRPALVTVADTILQVGLSSCL